MDTRFVSFDQTRLAVHTTGKGQLAVLLHGYPLDHRMWLDTMHGPLAERRTLVAIDLRGHGASPWCGDAMHTMDLLADDVAAVVHTISDEPVDVVGLSMGGYVAQAVWARHPQLVRSLCLVDTKAKGDDDAGKAGRDAAMRTVLEKGRPAIAAAMAGKLLAPRAETDPHGMLLRARLHSMVEGQPVETIVADLRGMRERPDRTPMLASITVPTLVVVGSEDALTPPDEAKRVAGAIPGARCVVVPGCGHLTPMENPAAFAREVSAFWPMD
ncbi:MAG: alpha/beta fold hydrolase [Planctomycetes bacterium]|nr:alpha/beta fold hydrolase [Planctomycetota bacterium]